MKMSYVPDVIARQVEKDCRSFQTRLFSKPKPKEQTMPYTKKGNKGGKKK